MAAHRLILVLVAILAAPASHVMAQQPEAEVLTFHFERPGLVVPVFTFTIHPDGSGTYVASYDNSPAPSKYAPSYPSAQPAPLVETTRPVVLSARTTALLFDRARSTDQFRGGCETKLKNIADTGAKTITYTGPQGTAKCTYNYSENKAVTTITETFQAIAETLDEGRTIEQKHRFDRLGLDQQLTILADNVRDGRALEVATIAEVLQALCNDSQVMDRVRQRAASLLQASANAH